MPEGAQRTEKGAARILGGEQTHFLAIIAPRYGVSISIVWPEDLTDHRNGGYIDESEFGDRESPAAL
jgi:hypothetical protein